MPNNFYDIFAGILTENGDSISTVSEQAIMAEFAALETALKDSQAELREAISTLIRHLTGYDVADEFDAADFRELQPRSWALYQKALKEPVENK